MPTQSVPEGVAKYLLIDGQQRLTTIFILLAALRDKIRTAPGTLADEIHGLYLTNQYKVGDEELKLLPTQVDRDSYRAIIQTESNNQSDQINKAYRFFEKRLNSSKSPDVSILKKTLINNLSLVSITLDKEDNPHLIFESLNAKGRPLTQADLIRNYFFMRIHAHQQEKIYESYWRPMQESLDENTPEFIRHFLMKDGGLIKQGEVYFALKDRANEHQTQVDIIAYLEKIAKFAGFYAKLINPDEEPKAKLCARLKRLNRIEVTVAYPFLLNVYQDYANNDISEEIFAECLDILENYMIRRFVCGVPTYGLNKIFPSLYAQAMQFDSLIPGLKEALKSKKYPRDTEFKERLITTPLYGGGDRTDKTKLILERLEESFEHKEPVAFEKTTIEHVMPQTPSSWWKSHLGGEWEEQHEIYLHTIGNLTLTGYNSELSNDTFPNKLVTLRESHLELNKYFQGVEGWTEKSIRQRAEALSSLALEVWKSFAPPSPSTVENNNSVTGKTPVAVTIVGEKVSVTSWRDVEQKTMEAIAELDDERFEDILGQFPKFIGREKAKFRSSRELKNGVFIETNLSAERIREFCIQATTFAGLDMDDWQVEYI